MEMKEGKESGQRAEGREGGERRVSLFGGKERERGRVTGGGGQRLEQKVSVSTNHSHLHRTLY